MFHVYVGGMACNDTKQFPYPDNGFSSEADAREYLIKRARYMSTSESSYSIKEVKPEPQPVTTQSHYAGLTPEPITVIEGWGLSYVRGNAIKYLARAGKKDQTKDGTIRDLEKAISYIKREISTLNGGPASWA